jgi:hypothetical protein
MEKFDIQRIFDDLVPQPPSAFAEPDLPQKQEKKRFIDELGLTPEEAAYRALDQPELWNVEERELLDGISDGIITDTWSLDHLDVLMRELWLGFRAVDNVTPVSKPKRDEDVEVRAVASPILRDPEVQVLVPAEDRWWEK